MTVPALRMYCESMLKLIMIETIIIVLISGTAAVLLHGGLSAFLNTVMIMGILYLYIGIGTPADKMDISPRTYDSRDIGFRFPLGGMGRFNGAHEVPPQRSLLVSGLAAILVSALMMYLKSRG